MARSHSSGLALQLRNLGFVELRLLDRGWLHLVEPLDVILIQLAYLALSTILIIFDSGVWSNVVSWLGGIRF